MIFGIGIDVVENARVADALRRHGDRFIQKIYHVGEAEYCRTMKDPAHHFAARFAAKEAVSNALGTGFAGQFRHEGDIKLSGLEFHRPDLCNAFEVNHASYLCASVVNAL
jgi:holo-[acyl-carrier-protein] synthase